MSETTVAVIEKVESKEGATNGKPWRKFGVKADSWYSTFDSAVADQAKALTGQRAEISWQPSGSAGQFKDVLSVKPAGAAVGDPTQDGIPTSRDEQGNADWDMIGLRKTRCLLWAHFLQSPLAAAIAAKDLAPVGDPGSVYRVGAHLIACAERDIYWREPAAADEDLPF